MAGSEDGMGEGSGDLAILRYATLCYVGLFF
jgi:hypothetical protein